jgi:hypothetical protein
MPPDKRPPEAPNELVRQRAGEYRTADGRFRIEQAGGGWFIVDTQQSDELGQPLLRGPLATLDAVRGALPGVRKVRRLPKNRAKVNETGSSG